MSESPFTYQYFQLEASNGEMRRFNNRPECRGQMAFIPSSPVFYLVAIDTEGYEHLVDIFYDRDLAFTAANSHWQRYGVRGLRDRSGGGTAEIYTSYAAPDGWAYIRLEGGTDAPRPSKVNWEGMEALIPEGAC